MGLESRFCGSLAGMLIGNSLGMPVQWISNIDDIHRQYGWVDHFFAPAANHCNANLEKGQVTAAGEFGWLLGRSIAEKGEFSAEAFTAKLKEFFTPETSSRYSFTNILKETLKKMGLEHLPANSQKEPKQKEVISWSAPVALRYWKNEKELFAKTDALARLSTDKDDVIEATNLIGLLLAKLLAGRKADEAFDSVAKNPYFSKLLKGKLSTIKPKLKNNTVQTIREYGIEGEPDMIIPAAIYTFIKYKDDFENALEYAVNTGGESSGRGAIVGSLSGALLGVESIPQRWRLGLLRFEETLELARRIYQASGPPPPPEPQRYFRLELKEQKEQKEPKEPRQPREKNRPAGKTDVPPATASEPAERRPAPEAPAADRQTNQALGNKGEQEEEKNNRPEKRD
jgi:ADP-ribosyl-[dinitrogen reductase] hydrolase